MDNPACAYVPFSSRPASGPFSGPNGAEEARAALAQLAREKHEKTLRRNPNDPTAILGIARHLSQDKHHPKAIEWMEEKGSVMKGSTSLQKLYAAELLALGEYAKCVRFLDDHPEVSQKDPLVGAIRIRAMIYDPSIGAKQMYEATSEWSRLFCADAFIQQAPAITPPVNRIRVGFVSTRLNHHNTAVPLYNLLTHAPRNEFEIVLFSDTGQVDEYTQKLRYMADEWHDISKRSCADAATVIRKRNIHILVDLMEYSNDSRLHLFGYKPAPIQLHWLANAVTTGMPAMDYRLSSAVADPEECDQWSAEKVIRIPNYYLYSPSSAAAKTVPSRRAPAEENGYVTFGAIHHLAKYNEDVLDAWRTILGRVDHSRVLLGRNDFQSENTREAFMQRLCRHGIPKERVELEGRQERIGSLEIFNRMDIVLDTWPYNGVASTEDGLWMGAPHITLYGSRTSGRRAADLLRLVGHPEWVAETRESYIDKVVALAGDMARLKEIRATLHDEFVASPICDHAQTARNIFKVFGQIMRPFSL